MDMDRGKMRVSSYVLLSASAVAGATAYAVTRLLAKTALDREAPKVARDYPKLCVNLLRGVE